MNRILAIQQCTESGAWLKVDLKSQSQSWGTQLFLVFPVSNVDWEESRLQAQGGKNTGKPDRDSTRFAVVVVTLAQALGTLDQNNS